MASKTIAKKTKVKSNNDFKICNNCNPKKYLKFNFSFYKENGTPAKEDAYRFIQRLNFLSSEIYQIMIYKFQGKKQQFIEDISIEKININIPSQFREIYPIQTNEKISIFRIYPSGSPNGSANPRIIGMIKKYHILCILY